MGQQDREVGNNCEAGGAGPAPGISSGKGIQPDDPEAAASFSTPPPTSGTMRWANLLFLITSAGFSLHLIRYYLVGMGGPTLLAVVMVPVAFILFVLDSLRTDALYPRLGRGANMVIAGVFIATCLVVLGYMKHEFMEIRTVRAGMWSGTDLVVGGLMFLLVMEFSRKKYFALFVLNIVLLLYTVYGWVVPGLFGHPGLSWERVISAMSVEMTTGVFSRLPQLALTLIGSFLLVLSVLRAFGCVDSLLNIASRIAVRSPNALPQAAVVGSFGVAAVSGSGAANAATTGSATIPAMIASGLPPTSAAAIETASSLGGQLMPPIMGIAAFLMADFLGRSYFDVVARGYAPALIYFAGVGVSVYLITVRHRKKMVSVPIVQATVNLTDWVNIAAYLAVVAGLVALMAIAGIAPMIAAVRLFIGIGVILSAVFFIRTFRTHRPLDLRALGAPFLRLIDSFARMTTELTLLLATLSIMTGAFVITGVPPKVGFLLMEAAGVNLVAMILVGFLFGAIVGTGLPPAPTYIITALVIAPPMIKAGVDPWVVHFFAFFLAVWGELTPPTSVVAAVAASIANTSFLRTLFKALGLCIGLFVLMGGIFTRPALVLAPGIGQLTAFALVLCGTIGFVFSIQTNFSENRFQDLSARIVLAGFSFLVVLHPNQGVAWAAAAPVVLFVVFWIIKRRPRMIET